MTAQILVVLEIRRFFGIFSIFFRKLRYKNFHKTWNYHLCSEVLSNFRVLSGVSNFAANYDCSNLVVFEIWCFLWFFPKFSKKYLEVKKFQNFEDINHVIGICEAAQILVVFEIWRFLGFFQNFSENLRLKIFTKLEIIIFLVRLCRGTHRSCEFCLQIGLLKILQFSRYDGFCDFSKKVSWKLN